MTEIQTENGALADTIEQYNKHEPHVIHQTEEVTIHLVNGQQVVTRHRDHERRPHGTTMVHNLGSMVDLVDQIKGPILGDTVTYCDSAKANITTVLDHDSPGREARDNSHRIGYTLKRTDEWANWVANDRKWLGQVPFAEFIEDHLRVITDPDDADLLELAQTFEATTSVEFRSAERLNNGEVQFTYAEDTNAAGGKTGQIAIPTHIRLSIVPYVGGEEIEVTARFRYRLRSTELTLGYVIEDLQGIEDQAFEQARDTIANLASWLVVDGVA